MAERQKTAAADAAVSDPIRVQSAQFAFGAVGSYDVKALKHIPLPAGRCRMTRYFVMVAAE